MTVSVHEPVSDSLITRLIPVVSCPSVTTSSFLFHLSSQKAFLTVLAGDQNIVLAEQPTVAMVHPDPSTYVSAPLSLLSSAYTSQSLQYPSPLAQSHDPQIH